MPRSPVKRAHQAQNPATDTSPTTELPVVRAKEPLHKTQTLGELWSSKDNRLSRRLGYGCALLIVALFYIIPSSFGQNGTLSAIQWAWNACNHETDYLHGRFVPLAIILLLVFHRREIAAVSVRPNNWGLAMIAVGLLAYLLAFRTLQPRLAIGALPLIILGAVGYLWGTQATRRIVFPISLIYFAIPLPNLIQATTKLQIVATETAYNISTFLGAKIVASGNIINSSSGEGWGFDIAEGCSGIRSLVAMTLIAAIYAHLTQDKLWKKLILLTLSVPIALIANGLRVTTIVLIAEYGEPDFAATAYHSFSGFLFIPLGIAGIVIADTLINRRIPLIASRPKQRTRMIKRSPA